MSKSLDAARRVLLRRHRAALRTSCRGYLMRALRANAGRPYDATPLVAQFGPDAVYRALAHLRIKMQWNIRPARSGIRWSYVYEPLVIG